ncbi:hypothetical protein BDZ94DRAFT_1248606 [Collybia nuda]|uniref:F-box domain-containing protein n=1 Tax=Collybia nuda TaxID=64659 RepID=A0A9P5YFI8_9AGAR|nr:hypothetical protein BDZ94DRAFT_1248606 [Collybia nuda]
MRKERTRRAQVQATLPNSTQQTTTARDLPLEVWLQIISLNPLRETRKLLGVSRVLFEYVMDDIYREVMLIPSDHSGPNLKTLFQISQPSIACRIEYLYIQPQFALSSLVHVNKLIQRALDAIVHFKGVRELYLHLHDLPTVPSFSTFLKHMWSTLGPRLQRLTINTTWAKLPVLLESIPSSVTLKLEELTVRLVATESALPRHHRKVFKSILTLIATHRETLQILRMSSFEQMDMSLFLSKLGHFPRLKKLCIFFTLSSRTLSNPKALSYFLDTHRETLEHFCI